jgi:hypothetical protein
MHDLPKVLGILLLVVIWAPVRTSTISRCCPGLLSIADARSHGITSNELRRTRDIAAHNCMCTP